ncbi:MAG: hypothetical protein ACJ79K_09580 [Gemmatimonadaceae bacterium]
MTAARALFSGNPADVAERISPLLRLEIASIGAIMAATNREVDPGYAYLLREAKTGKQANAEQMNTLLRLAGQKQVESGGLTDPVLRLQTLALQKTNTTAMLQAMRLVEETLVARYRELTAGLNGFELRAMTVVRDRAVKHWMILIAHVAQRKDGDSSHASLLPLPLSSCFATDAARVCMRCLLDRPGESPALEKKNPYTYVCAACHDEVAGEFPPDLVSGLERSPTALRRDRIIAKALSRPQKLKAIKEVHAAYAGLEPVIPPPAKEKRGDSPPARVNHPTMRQPASDISIERDGVAPDELAYTDLLFDFRSVRRSW